MRRKVEAELGGQRSLWMRVLGMVLLGALGLFLLSLPALASDESQWRPSLAWYLLLALTLAGVTARSYVLVRRSGASKMCALAVAVAVVPGSYCAAVLLFFLIVMLSTAA